MKRGQSITQKIHFATGLTRSGDFGSINTDIDALFRLGGLLRQGDRQHPILERRLDCGGIHVSPHGQLTNELAHMAFLANQLAVLLFLFFLARLALDGQDAVIQRNLDIFFFTPGISTLTL